jgi:hypothetical protein
MCSRPLQRATSGTISRDLRPNDSGDDPVSRGDEGEASMSEHVENEERDQQTEASPEAE